jgi:hypothetical protein
LHAHESFRGRLACGLVVTLGIWAVVLAGAAASRAEGVNPNGYECLGSVKAGESEPGSEGTAVRYEFHCNGPITGYQLESQIPLVGLQASPLVANQKGEPQKESFSCGGELPGYALNCVGSANAEYDQITGQFYIEAKLCTEPREDPLLTVTYAYLEKGVVTQAISGPYDLGRPVDCPPDAESGGTRLSPKPASHSSKHKHAGSGKKGKKHHGKGKRKK